MFITRRKTFPQLAGAHSCQESIKARKTWLSCKWYEKFRILCTYMFASSKTASDRKAPKTQNNYFPTKFRYLSLWMIKENFHQKVIFPVLILLYLPTCFPHTYYYLQKNRFVTNLWNSRGAGRFSQKIFSKFSMGYPNFCPFWEM